MSTPAKTIPEIPTTSTVSNTDAFLVALQNAAKPDQVTWSTMLTQAISAVPTTYYNGG